MGPLVDMELLASDLALKALLLLGPLVVAELLASVAAVQAPLVVVELLASLVAAQARGCCQLRLVERPCCRRLVAAILRHKAHFVVQRLLSEHDLRVPHKFRLTTSSLHCHYYY